MNCIPSALQTKPLITDRPEIAAITWRKGKKAR